MAPRGGWRAGAGRKRGVKNRSTLEKERLAQRLAGNEIAEARATGRKLGRDVLEEGMNALMGMAAHYQPLPPGADPDPRRTPDWEKFKDCMQLGLWAAAKLAEFQSPKFKAIAISPVMPGDRATDVTPKDGVVVPMNDPLRAARVYQLLVQRKVSA